MFNMVYMCMKWIDQIPFGITSKKTTTMHVKQMTNAHKYTWADKNIYKHRIRTGDPMTWDKYTKTQTNKSRKSKGVFFVLSYKSQ